MGRDQYRDRQGAAKGQADCPLAYLVTFRCYGTWLHGDARGSVDRNHNVHDTPLVSPDRRLLARRAAMLKAEPVFLEPAHRVVVEQTLRDVSAFHGWTLHAVNVRTNHVHAVVSAACAPERVLNAWKSWSTRRLREAGLVSSSRRMWSRHGSTRYLWSEESLNQACLYVEEGQGEDESLPNAAP